MAFVKDTRLRVVNNTESDITTTIVSMVDNHDFFLSDTSRPDRNFHGVSIAAGQYKEEVETVNAFASNCPFNLTLIFDDGTKDSFRVNMKYAILEAQPGFSHYEGERKITYDRQGTNTLVITISKK